MIVTLPFCGLILYKLGLHIWFKLVSNENDQV